MGWGLEDKHNARPEVTSTRVPILSSNDCRAVSTRWRVHGESRGPKEGTSERHSVTKCQLQRPDAPTPWRPDPSSEPLGPRRGHRGCSREGGRPAQTAEVPLSLFYILEFPIRFHLEKEFQ